MFFLRILLIAIILPLAFVRGSTQETMFAYGFTGAADDFGPTPVTGYKLEVVQKVVNDLIRARGDQRKARPELVMNKGRRYVAWMDPTKRVIGVEEKAYDLCRTYGKDSLNVLASLLAHELTHYYENHDWSRHFVHQNQELNTSDSIGGLAEGIKLEAQADQLGGMLAISAGYDGYAHMPDFLRKTYAAYDFTNQLQGYPSLEDRVKISENAAAGLKQLHGVYQTANLLTLIDAYEPALIYYEHVLGTFQSYEVYNNAGVCAALAALDLTNPEEMPFALPLELDPTSRLDALATRLPEDPVARKEALLQKAHQFLNSATELTTTEAVGYLNLAIVTLLEGEMDEAEFLALRAQKIARKEGQAKTQGDALITQGIIAGRQGDPEAARKYFEQARKFSPNLSELNLRIMAKNPMVERPKPRTATGSEKIGTQFLDDFLYNPVTDVEVALTESTFCGKKSYDHSEILLHFADGGDNYAIFQSTKQGYSGASRLGGKIGDTLSAIKNLYSSPDKVIQLRNGTCYRYNAAGILFFFDTQDHLTHWTIFEQQLAKQ